MEQPLIIGIHGLANKPDERTLEKDWRSAIDEGLKNIQKSIKPDYEFKMVYWAKHIYKYPLHNKPEFSHDNLFNDEPYKSAKAGTLKPYHKKFSITVATSAIYIVGKAAKYSKIRSAINFLANRLMPLLVKDLDLYYKNKKLNKALRNELKKILLENKDRKIMLVSHSMGTIIAYDVLSQLGQSHPEFAIDHFVTLGSPLGLSVVKDNIRKEFKHRGSKRLKTPSAVKRSWDNFADRRDPIALDARLRGDFEQNSSEIRCVDNWVFNDFRVPDLDGGKANRNYHKSYGYLRTPEFSQVVKNFL